MHTLAQPPENWSLSPQNQQPETQGKEQPFSIFLHQGILKSRIHCPNAERKLSAADHSSHRYFPSTDSLLHSALEEGKPSQEGRFSVCRKLGCPWEKQLPTKHSNPEQAWLRRGGAVLGAGGTRRRRRTSQAARPCFTSRKRLEQEWLPACLPHIRPHPGPPTAPVPGKTPCTVFITVLTTLQ